MGSEITISLTAIQTYQKRAKDMKGEKNEYA